MKLDLFDKNGLLLEREIRLSENSVEPGTLLFDPPVVLEEGFYAIQLYSSAAGKEYELLLEQELQVTKEEAEVTPVPTETEKAPVVTNAPEPEPEDQGGLASVPIYIWFLVGAAIVAILVYMIAVLLKRN